MSTRKKIIKKKKKTGPKRHIRKSLVVAVVAVALLISGIIFIPQWVTNSSLRSLGYSDSAIKVIQKEKLSSLLLKDKSYSAYLEDCIVDGSFNADYLKLYTLVDEQRGLTDSDFILYNRLVDIGYEEDQLENLFSRLYFWEITPLLLFDYQWDDITYIEDCEENREMNSGQAFSLSGNYWKSYKLTEPVISNDDTALVNVHYYLDPAYVPEDLTTITTEYAADGQQLTKEAADAFLSMAKAGLNAGNPFFASVTYRSYEQQENAYTTISSLYGTSNADILSTRAGFSEHQTGLAVNVACTYEDNDDFLNTEVYRWLISNCTKYGFIARYPENKYDLTKMDDEPNHFRYVGKELAKKIEESKLTYDEYYMLYLAPWYEEKNVPSEELRNQTDCTDTIQTK